VPGGEFKMGSLIKEKGRYQNEGPQRPVKVNAFLLCRTECTRAGWALRGSENRRRSNEDDMPVGNRSWYDCTEWCRKAGLRLPTEAEWEYACRAGTRTAFCHGDSAADLSNYAWYIANSINRAHPAGRKKPNAFGLFDMHGNLWEWCQDTYRTADSSNGADKYALKTSGKASRVTRGGGWNFHARFCRSAYRSGDFPHERSSLLGFRPAFTLP
jgi:formylglycine-generating enzyme required for sulfatase activity